MSTMNTSANTLARAVATGGGWLLRSRRLMRAPIWLYRARLGLLFGSRMLMLEHTGRRSGVRRQVVLEVFGRLEPDTYVVVSGFGARSQWFRNLQSNPQARVYLGSRPPARAVARLLTATEADNVLRAYVARHPRAWHRFKPILENTLGTAIDSGAQVPMVGLQRLD